VGFKVMILKVCVRKFDSGQDVRAFQILVASKSENRNEEQRIVVIILDFFKCCNIKMIRATRLSRLPFGCIAGMLIRSKICEAMWSIL
jgi:hypothetical protein